MTTTSAPPDKLDAAAPPGPVWAADSGVVNGPEGEDLDWHAIN